VTEILSDPRALWLKERRTIVTASDAAAILGEDPRRGGLAIYAEKIGALSQADEDWLAFGRDVEGAVANGYARRTGRPVHDLGAFEIQRHPALPWLGATLDRITEGTGELPAPAADPGPLECKAVTSRHVRAAAFEREPPIAYQIQLQVQMACTGATWGSLVALVGGIQVVVEGHRRATTVSWRPRSRASRSSISA
jgi:putative phage-type endonuclease